MDHRTNRLATIAREAFLIWAQDNDDAVSVETGIENTLLLQQALRVFGAASGWSATMEAHKLCTNLLAKYREHGTDPDGETSVDLFNTLSDIFPTW